MDICLHLGAHRTGTTSLQRYLNLNRQVLSDHGIAFWGPRRTRAGFLEGLLRNPDHLTAQDHKLGRRTVGRVQMEQKRLREKGCNTIVISEENLLGTMSGNLMTQRLYPQAQRRLQRLAPAFKGSNLRIGLSIRSYDAHWTSQMAFRIKVGGALPEAEAIDRIATQPRRWRHLVEDIARVFPQAQIMVWPFEGWIGQPEQMLSALLGASIPVGMIQFNECSNASPDVTELHKILRDSGNGKAAEALAGFHGPYRPLPQLHREKLKNDYRDDIDWLLTGADGLATYLDPTGGTSGGHDRPEGSMIHDIEESRLAGAG